MKKLLQKCVGGGSCKANEFREPPGIKNIVSAKLVAKRLRQRANERERARKVFEILKSRVPYNPRLMIKMSSVSKGNTNTLKRLDETILKKNFSNLNFDERTRLVKLAQKAPQNTFTPSQLRRVSKLLNDIRQFMNTEDIQFKNTRTNARTGNPIVVSRSINYGNMQKVSNRYKAYVRNNRRRSPSPPRARSPLLLPFLPRNFGTWVPPYGKDKFWMSRNGEYRYYPNSNRLVVMGTGKEYGKASKIFGLKF